MLKKLIVSLIVIVALGIGGLSAYVSTIDWNQHKNKIARQIENVTGKKVVFEGSIGMSFFPTPYLTAKNIKIYNNDGSLEPLAVVREMVTDLSLVPLLHGRFEVNNMSLLNATILIEFMPDGKLNWYSEVTDSQRDSISSVDIAFNSVMLKDASVQIINKGLGVDVTLQNVNAEIAAQSLKGPYRIDGNFVKDNNPAGFALNLGTLSESFATSLNLVLTHPTTESYARFDGSMLTSNNEIKGNFIVESQNPSSFINGLTGQTILPTEYNYPLAFSVEINTNPKQIDLSGFVLKYGENMAGSGNILIPLEHPVGDKKRKIEIGFEMTDLDLNPIAAMIKEQVKKYDNTQTPYDPYFDFDMIVDVKAVKAVYDNQSIRNVNLSLDLVNDVFSVQNFSGLFPGDTDVTITGDVFSNEKKLSYDFNVKTLSQDTLKFLEWLKLKPETYAPSTYRGGSTSFKISGDLQQIKIMPLEVDVDKISIGGVVGIIRERRPQLFIALESDSINFDNYLPALSEEEKKLPLAEKFRLCLNRLKFLNDADIHFEGKLNHGIYNSTPLDGLKVDLDSENGTIKISQLSVENLASSVIELSGTVSGLGLNPRFENLKYNFSTANFADFTRRFVLPLPDWPLITDAKKVEAKGIFTGNLTEATIKAVTAIDNFSSVYQGKLYNQENKLNFKGALEFKTPDFTKFINQIGFAYRPQNIAANIFTFRSTVDGNADDWRAGDINVFVGSNNFTGNIAMVKADNRPRITFDLTANKFEFDRFIYNPGSDIAATLPSPAAGENLFLERPVLNPAKINYEFYKTFDMEGKFNTAALNLGTRYFENASAQVSINHGLIKVSNFKAVKEGAPIEAAFELDVNSDPKVKGSAGISNYQINYLGGKKYALTGGTLKARAEFEGPADSEQNLFENLNGKLSFDINKAEFKGLDIEVIEDDLSKRTHSDNLSDFLREYLQRGQSKFELVGAEADFKDGNFTFNDALAASSLATVDIAGNGSLKKWDIDASFRVVFERLHDQIVPIEFKWTGLLNNPNLMVDDSALKNKYDNYWEKIAQDKQAAEDARINALNQSMAKTQEKVLLLKDFAKFEVFPRLEKYKPLSSNAEIRSKYDSIHIVANDINNQLEMMQEKASLPFDDNDIMEMNATLDTLDPQLKELVLEIDENFVTDTKNHAAEAYNAISQIYANSKIKAENYQKTLDAYVFRLLQLGSLVVLDRDPRATDWKNQIETSLRAIEDINAKSDDVRERVERTQDLTELESLHQQMRELEKKSNTELEKLNSGMEDLFNYAKKLVREEEGYTQPEEQNEDVENEEEPEAETPPAAEDSTSAEPQPTTPAAPLPAEKDVKDLQPVSQPEAPAPAPAPEPVLIPIENKAETYQSKLLPSGTLTKAGKSLEVIAKSPTEDNKPQPLLRPISEKSVTSGGIIKKKH